MALSREGRLWFWLAGIALFVLLLLLLRSILLPFVAGMAVAYFLDPLLHRLQTLGLSRSLATVIVTLSFFFFAALLLVLLVPLIEDQVLGFAAKVPGYVQQLIVRAEPLWRAVKAHLSPSDIEKLRNAAGEYAGTVAGWLGAFFSHLLTGSLAIVNLLSLVFVTPVVTFYMLRDWNGITSRIEAWLPQRQASTIKEQLKAIDAILSGFVRGQALVCLSLGTFYAIGLSVVGLDLGLVVGAMAGIFSFVPYLGTISGFITSIGLALAQSQDWTLPILVAGVFLVGNLLEGYVLAPKLVGEKIGLHPVWVIFAVLAGGALFGFLGVLLALPVAAVTGVLARFALSRYLGSSLYSGERPEGTAP